MSHRRFAKLSPSCRCSWDDDVIITQIWEPNQQLLTLIKLTVVVSDNYFCLVPFIPLGVLRERSGFNCFPYSILIGGLYFMVAYMENYSCSWTIKYDVIILVSYSQCHRNNVTIIKLLVWWRFGFQMHKIFRIRYIICK